MTSSPALAQSDAPNNGWVDVNLLGIRSQQGEQSVTFTTTLFGDTLTAAAAYPEIRATGRAVEFGGGFLLLAGTAGGLGIGIHVDALNIQQVSGLAITVPHPLVFGRSATARSSSSVLERRDRNIDIQAIYFAPTPSAWSVRLFGGPTYLRVEEERVRVIDYNQAVTTLGGNVVTIAGAPTADVEGSGWGFNVGGDVAFFFSRYVGVGAVVRVSTGTVALADPFNADDVDREAGHTAFGGGLRLRF
jgi:hypothetical protein